jgi:hypothetical protein
MDQNDLADLIVEIFDGVTVLSSSFGPIYIKHFHQLDTRKMLSQRNVYLDEAKKRGLISEKDALDALIKDEMWDWESENEIQKKITFIENLKKSTSKINIPSKRESHQKLINNEQNKLAELSFERQNLLGLTAEKYVDKKVNKEFFESLVFYDSDLKNNVFESIDYSERKKLSELSEMESVFFTRMSEKNISKAVLSPFYSAYLPYSEDPMGLFGTPLKNLTAFQLKMLTYARTFLNIFKNSQKEIPESIAKDPELLISYYEAQKNNAQPKGKGSEGDGGTTYFGANKDDIRQMKAEDEEAIDLSKAVESSGGSMNMQDLMKLHGI